MFTVDYTPKILHVAIKGLEYRVVPTNSDSENGLIYMPENVFSKVNTTSERMYHDFFKKGESHIVIPLETEQGPGELVKTLNKEFGIEYCMVVGGITAPFSATQEQARNLLIELKNNPLKYFNSPEKDIFSPDYEFLE